MRINLADGIGFDFGYANFGFGVYQWSTSALGSSGDAQALTKGFKEGLRLNYYLSQFGRSGFYLSAGVARIAWLGIASRTSDATQWVGSGSGSMRSYFAGYILYRGSFNFNFALGSQLATLGPYALTSTTAEPLSGLPLKFSYGGFDVGVGVHFYSFCFRVATIWQG
jgi:hypothetical protein